MGRLIKTKPDSGGEWMTTVKLKSDGGDYFYKQKRW
jgi:hypothetical protein